MRGTLSLVALGLLAAACGGRSSLGIPGRLDGGARYDGTPHYGDGLPWKKDGPVVVTPDLRPPTKKDLYRPPDASKPPPDFGCLPLPPGQVTGKYKGAWKGTISCPGLAQQAMSGTLNLSLTKVAGATSLFSASGSLEGQLDLGLPVAGSFSGTMSCTALKATVPQIVIGSGAMIYKLQGGLSGTYALAASGAGGFPSGSIDIKDPNLGCTASGTWYAYK